MREKEKNVLGIDWGTKYIGLAYKQGSTGMVFPIGYVINDKGLMYQLSELLVQYHIGNVVVGWPKRQKNIQEKIKGFVLTLQSVVGSDMDISYVDEDYSSVQAGAKLGDFQKHAGEDTLAAMEILERI